MICQWYNWLERIHQTRSSAQCRLYPDRILEELGNPHIYIFGISKTILYGGGFQAICRIAKFRGQKYNP